MKQTENYARELENNLRAEHAIKHGTTHALNELITREQNEGEADHETN
jgi:N-methylhydantoinase A/oxoprolinase/acetone carboxylase beta subunit